MSSESSRVCLAFLNLQEFLQGFIAHQANGILGHNLEGVGYPAPAVPVRDPTNHKQHVMEQDHWHNIPCLFETTGNCAIWIHNGILTLEMPEAHTPLLADIPHCPKHARHMQLYDQQHTLTPQAQHRPLHATTAHTDLLKVSTYHESLSRQIQTNSFIQGASQ
jgi:hypothetical protein